MANGRCDLCRDWSGTVHKTIPLIAKMQSKILLPFPWSPVK